MDVRNVDPIAPNRFGVHSRLDSSPSVATRIQKSVDVLNKQLSEDRIIYGKDLTPPCEPTTAKKERD